MILRIRNFDWILLTSIIVVAFASLITLVSSDVNSFWRQLIWYILVFIVIFFGVHLDWRWLGGQSWFRNGLYWFSVVLLVLSNLQLRTVRGTRSWLFLGSFQFEPVELAKLALILLLADFFSRRHISAWQGRNILSSFIYTLIPTFLVLIHPDFGSAVVLAGIWVGFLMLSGINKKRFLIGFVIVILLGVVIWMFFLKSYQQDRLLGFIFPEHDPLGINYNVNQSKIAIGSAGLWGKGFGGGTQVQLGFLPAAQTDFIFAAFVEEWGFIGGAVIVLTYLIIMYRLINTGLKARDNYSRFIVLGGVLFLAIHFFINLGSNLGFMPVTGIPLPFFSYGGSNLLTMAILIGIIGHIKLESR
ncbi:MAG: FtsW/RodA/SpoVE family cell cycle protein [Patescibacteria group bacterium]|nr:FtsW/RodA/SpoVE family cell cycle protein [Patescibacteria group bacterium]